MKQTTNKLVKSDDKKHSIVFKPNGNQDNPVVTAIYIMRGVIPFPNVQECKITVSFPEGGQDEAYNKL